MKKLRSFALSLALVGLALGPASCDSSSSGPGQESTPRFEPRLVGYWTWVMDYMSWVDFRENGQGMVYIDGMGLKDSLPFTWTASGGTLTTTMRDSTRTGTYRFFGNDSVEIKNPGLGTGLMLRSATRPD